MRWDKDVGLTDGLIVEILRWFIFISIGIKTRF